jgi:hypothetical protein
MLGSAAFVSYSGSVWLVWEKHVHALLDPRLGRILVHGD